MSRISIKARITVWYTLIIVVISAIAFMVMMSVSREMLIQDSKNRLITSVERIVHMINAPRELLPQNDNAREEAPKPPPPPGDDIDSHNQGDNAEFSAPNDDFRKMPGYRFFNNGVHTAIYDESSAIISGAIPFEFADDIAFIDGETQEKNFDGSTYLIYSKKTLSNDNVQYWVVGVISIADESILYQSVGKTNIILILILICMSALGGYFILNQAFKPVSKISSTAKLISESNDLSQRIALKGGKDEIYDLANTFDEMLDKIERTLENEKQFTSDASHELRTPVAVISSECEYTLECAASLEEAKESVLSIKRQTDKMTKLISELLTISRMDRNTMDISRENVNISELLSFVCDEQEEIHKTGITLRRDIMPDIFLTTDSMLMARIFINLISNAYSYGRENGSIDVTLLENDNEIMFRVADDGIGIAEENLPKIWERFYQVNTSRTNTDGSMGLGLAMVKLIADKLGASMSVKSELGEGSVFTMVIKKSEEPRV